MARANPTRRRVDGALLAAARKSCGVTQEQLARVLDVRLATISERENSGPVVIAGNSVTGGVPWEVWLAWAMALGVPSDWRPVETTPGATSTKTPT